MAVQGLISLWRVQSQPGTYVLVVDPKITKEGFSPKKC